MSKVAEYLAEHILGEAVSRPSIMTEYSHDRSVLEKRPEMVLFPRSTADVRKVATFCWQLAEKGHTLALTTRGAGKNTDGSAIGRGAILELARHMNRIFEYESKQRLVRLQPGTRIGDLKNSLGLYGAGVPLLADCDPTATVGGAIASGMSGTRQTKYGMLSATVSQLEVVLANGDVIQTGRLSKRELNRKKGLETLEGEIYRKLDNLLDDNASLVRDTTQPTDRAGYPGIFDVKQKNGSFDLTPLFVGSQGTLGVASELILNTEVVATEESAVAVTFGDKADARDAAREIRKVEPAYAEYIDGEIFAAAKANGKKYDLLGDGSFAAMIVIGFDDVTAKVRQKKIKKLQKTFAKTSAHVVTISDERVEHIQAIRDVAKSAYTTATNDVSWPPLFDHFYVPEERMEEFVTNLTTLMGKYRFDLPLRGDVLANIYSIRPQLYLRRVADKQKIFKLIDELGSVVSHVDGALVGDGGEGRLQAKFALKQLDPAVRDMYAEVKTIFDPHGILNPGVKEDGDLRDLVAMLRSDY